MPEAPRLRARGGVGIVQCACCAIVTWSFASAPAVARDLIEVDLPPTEERPLFENPQTDTGGRPPPAARDDQAIQDIRRLNLEALMQIELLPVVTVAGIEERWLRTTSEAVELNSHICFVDRAPAQSASAYTRLDMGVTWLPHPKFEVWGMSLLLRRHPEFSELLFLAAPVEVERSVYLQGTIRY